MGRAKKLRAKMSDGSADPTPSDLTPSDSRGRNAAPNAIKEKQCAAGQRVACTVASKEDCEMKAPDGVGGMGREAQRAAVHSVAKEMPLRTIGEIAGNMASETAGGAAGGSGSGLVGSGDPCGMDDVDIDGQKCGDSNEMAARTTRRCTAV